MGMFDWVEYEADCPNCGEPLEGFQTKDAENFLHSLEVSDLNPGDEFYTGCDHCKTWVEYLIGDDGPEIYITEIPTKVQFQAACPICASSINEFTTSLYGEGGSVRWKDLPTNQRFNGRCCGSYHIYESSDCKKVKVQSCNTRVTYIILEGKPTLDSLFHEYTFDGEFKSVVWNRGSSTKSKEKLLAALLKNQKNYANGEKVDLSESFRKFALPLLRGEGE